MRLMWGGDNLPTVLPASAEAPVHAGSFFLPPSGVHVTLIHFLPDAEAKDAAGGALGDVMSARDGMHQTVSMDVGSVISGELGIQLDSGDIVWLEPGDRIVQNGTRHRWINRTDEPAVAGFVTLGATRESI